jgi:hypothetical protein
MLPIGGCGRYVVSECQMPPKLLRSCSSFTTGVIIGDSGSPLSCGYSTGSPNLLREGELLQRRHGFLVAQKDHQVLEQRLAYSPTPPRRRDPAPCPLREISAPSAPEIGLTSMWR